VPLPKGRFASVSRYETEYSGMVSGLRVDPKDGTLTVGWQIQTPPFNWDLGSTGKGPSSGWAFWTSYNSEMAHETLEATSTQGDRDYAAFVNWRAAEQAVRDGRSTMVGGVPVIDPAKAPGVLYFVPVPKSPHGIDTDPTGRWIVASGKLAPVVSVFDFEKVQAAVASRQFEGDVRGVPVLRHDSILEGEVPVGLGPLHTQYDGRGNAYTSLFIESVVTKWRLPPWSNEDRADLNRAVLDKIPVHHNIGHLVVGGSDTREPYGRYLVAMNKLSKGRHLSVGPSQPETSQLIDISGEKMTMLYEAFTEPEPHFAQILKADRIAPIEVYPRAENTNPQAVWSAAETSVTRSGNRVAVKMLAIRSRLVPDQIEVTAGDEVTIHLTNAEQTTDMIHGLGIAEHNINVIVDPGETKSVRFIVGKTGVFPFYCTNFCSALHQEMSGYLAVRPR
jgi:nitrous-oxide reductase